MNRLESIKERLDFEMYANGSEALAQGDIEYLLQRLEIAQNELGKIYQLANGTNANDMIIRQKAAEALDQLKE